MNRKFGIGFLILSFGFSNITLGWADEAIEVAPVVVQPYEIQELNQQMVDRDRQNRDEEIAIKQLIEDNDKLTQTALARQQDEGLAKIDQTMLSYRDALISRDRARIVANGERGWTSRYGDLIALTEDADAMTVHQDLESRSGLLAEKYQMLTELKDEMTALNDKLKDQNEAKLNQKEATIDGYQKTAQDQQDKVQMLVNRLSEMDKKIAHFDEIIAEKDHQIAQLKESLSDAQNQLAILQAQPKENFSPSNNQQQTVPEANAKDEIIKEKQAQVDLLKSELENKITELNARGPKEGIIQDQEHQISILKAQAQELSSKEDLMKAQADQMARVSEQFKDQSAMYADVKNQVMDLRNKIQQQDADLKARDESIRWLNRVVAVTKNKAEYYHLTSQQDQMSMKQVQEQVQNIKDDFAKHFKDYDQFQNAIVSLKSQVSQLGLQLSQKQAQVDMLRSQLEDKTAQVNDQKDQVIKMKADVVSILQAQADKEIYRRNAAAQVDDRIKLAKQLIDLQQQEAALLEEKSALYEAQDTNFDKHFTVLEAKIKAFLASRQVQTVEIQNHMEELKNELYQKQQQVDLLNTELKDKIAEEKNDSVLADQVQDLKAQLQDKEGQIASMQNDIQQGQKTKEEVDSIKQQLLSQQDELVQLKQQLENKIAQSGQMSVMLGDYQKKLESKDNAYNEQLGQILSFRNYKVQMEKQIADLNARLQEKEAQVVNIKKDMYDLQESIDAKDRDIQTKDLNLSMIQQKAVDDKIREFQAQINGLHAVNVRQAEEMTSLRTELALARQQLDGMPSTDEIDFLRTGLKKATMELKQKDDMLSQIKVNADEYAKEFKEQTREFQSLKEQLLDAQQAIARKDEDLKYKDMAITRLKGLSRTSESGLKTQVLLLTQRIDATEKKLMSKTHENRVEALQAQLKSANLQIKDLQAELDHYKMPSSNDPLGEKLKQALDKIDQQGRVINTLFQKLQDCGKTVDLTKDSGDK